MRTIDFKTVPIEDVNGKLKPIDISESFGNFLYNNTTDIGEMDMARKIYHEGRVEFTDEQIARMRYTTASSPELFARIRIAVVALLDQSISNKTKGESISPTTR